MVNPRRFLPVLALLAAAASLRADEPRWNVTAECQMVTLPQKTALALLPDLLDDAKIDAAYARVQESLAKGEAQLAANLIARTGGKKPNQVPAEQNQPNGGPADKSVAMVAESTEEIRYGTEFDPPNLPQGVVDNPAILEKWPHVGIVATGFETRNIGAALSLNAAVQDDGRMLSIDCTPTHVRLLRMVKIDCGRLPGGERLFIEQPIFHTLKNTCSLYLRSGQRVLLGVHKLTEPADTMELFFLRVTAAKVP